MKRTLRDRFQISLLILLNLSKSITFHPLTQNHWKTYGFLMISGTTEFN